MRVLLFTKFGELTNNLKIMQVLEPVQALLEAVGHSDDAIAAITFNFWHRLAKQARREIEEHACVFY